MRLSLSPKNEFIRHLAAISEHFSFPLLIAAIAHRPLQESSFSFSPMPSREVDLICAVCAILFIILGIIASFIF